MKKTLVKFLLVVSMLAFGSFAQATLLTFELDTEFSGATAPAGSTPWLTATFDDGGTPGSVRLTMDATNLVGTEFVSKWLFNVDPVFNPGLVGVSPVSISAVDSVALSRGTNCCKADGDGFFDFEFVFPTSGNRFTAGESVIVDFTATGLIASSFDFLSLGSGNSPDGLLTAAHIQSIGPAGESGWITAGDTPQVPVPSTMLLLGSGLIALGAFNRKLRK